MSGPTQNVGTTLTGGIQDISALLPLLGTDQCEQHVGSALDEGYLYAAAAPLSIFGCLGIVKAGISILISSISIPIPKVSISLHPFTMRFSQEQWLGARTLNNAGFKPVGTVAPLIAMDGDRYKAEMRLMEILGEKNIDNSENLSIEWESRKWNISLVLFTLLAAALSGTPYIALLLQDRGSQPSLVHSPWIFPLLRAVGSCLATVCCQFLVQSRIISLMKNRIVFMVMNRVLIDDLSKKHGKVEMDHWLKQYLQWDVDLPAEQCLWSLKQFLSSSFTQPMSGTNKSEDPSHVSLAMSTFPFSNPEDISRQLQDLHVKHFPTPTSDYVFMLISWILLCLSLPATVAGYIGCFTLVSNSPGNGSIFWLGLEAVLSIVRILVWAWNPSWDEKTDVTVKLELTKDQLLVTTETDVEIIKSTGDNTLALIPERRFLEWITPYTGPLEQFRTSESLFLYFTLTSTTNQLKKECLLYMTVFDFNKRLAVTLLREEGVLKYIDATVSCNQISSEMEASLRSASGEEHPWATNDATLFEALADYYKSIIQALNRFHLDSRAPDNSQLYLDKHRDSHTVTAPLPRKWSLLPQENESNNQSPDWQVLGSPTERDQLYLGRGYEHHLKTELIEKWSSWIVSDLHALQKDSRNDCYCALVNVSSDAAKLELTELDMQLVWEWTRRELDLVLSSAKIEDVLKRRMDECIDKITNAQGNVSGRLREWMLSEFRIGRRKRLEKERGQAKERMEKEVKDASKRAEVEGRPWVEEIEEYSPSPRWKAALEFIDKQWSAVIDHSVVENAVSDPNKGVFESLWPYKMNLNPSGRVSLVEQVRQRFEHWNPQRENERCEMDATIVRISQSEGEHLYHAYQYPDPHEQATARFVTLKYLESQWKVCAATVYDVEDCREDHIRDVINKSTTRSVINVDPALIESIPQNDHLLYIGFSGDGGKEPAFIQRNRDRWWDQQTGNSSSFYFTPTTLSWDGASLSNCGQSFKSTIAHIFIFLKTPFRLELHLLHRLYNAGISVSFHEKGEKLRHITRETSNGPYRLQVQHFKLDQFKPGRHELEVVVTGRYYDLEDMGFYVLRDILIEFFDDSPLFSSLDNTGSNLATKVQHGDADAGSSGTGLGYRLRRR